MTEEKLKELLNDQAFQDEMNNAATLEDAAKVMQQHGVQITPEKLQEIMAKVTSESELSENELDDVAGGLSVRAVRRVLYWSGYWSGYWTGKLHRHFLELIR